MDCNWAGPLIEDVFKHNLNYKLDWKTVLTARQTCKRWRDAFETTHAKFVFHRQSPLFLLPNLPRSLLRVEEVFLLDNEDADLWVLLCDGFLRSSCKINKLKIRLQANWPSVLLPMLLQRAESLQQRLEIHLQIEEVNYRPRPDPAHLIGLKTITSIELSTEHSFTCLFASVIASLPNLTCCGLEFRSFATDGLLEMINALSFNCSVTSLTLTRPERCPDVFQRFNSFLEQLRLCTSLQCLRMRNIAPLMDGEDNEMCIITPLTRLTSLRAESEFVADSQTLLRLRSLETFEVSHNNFAPLREFIRNSAYLVDLACGPFSANSHLVGVVDALNERLHCKMYSLRLNIGCEKLEADALNPILELLEAGLETLSIRQFSFSSDHWTLFSDVMRHNTSLTDLELLSMRGDRGGVPAALSDALRQNQSLSRLVLAGGPEMAPSLHEMLVYSKNLSTLEIWECALSDDHLAMLIHGIKKNSQLKSFSANGFLGTQSCKELCSLLDYPQDSVLQELWIGAHGVYRFKMGLEKMLEVLDALALSSILHEVSLPFRSPKDAEDHRRFDAAVRSVRVAKTLNLISDI